MKLTIFFFYIITEIYIYIHNFLHNYRNGILCTFECLLKCEGFASAAGISNEENWIH